MANPRPLEAPVTIAVLVEVIALPISRSWCGRPSGVAVWSARRSADVGRGERVVVRALDHGVQGTSSHAEVSPAEDREGEGVLQQSVERVGQVVALDTDHPCEVGDDADGGLGTE